MKWWGEFGEGGKGGGNVSREEGGGKTDREWGVTD